MAVYTLNFIPKGKTAKAQAKETLGYNGKRPGRDAEEIDRKLFGHGGEYTSEQALQMIDEAPANTYFFRMMVSPDPNTENKDRNLDLRLLTTQMVEWLEARLNREIPFIGAEHDDHTKIPHIHAIAFIQRQGREMLIDRDTINALREYATEMSLKQKQELTEEIALNVAPTENIAPAIKQEGRQSQFIGIADGKVTHIFQQTPARRIKQQTLDSCIHCHVRQSVIKLDSGVHWCKACETVQEVKLELHRSEGLSL